MSEAVQMQYIPLDDLEYGRTRYIRQNVVEDIKDRIETDGYNPARPLRVIPENGHYIVADGNHRLKTLRELGWDGDDTVLCVPEPDGDLYEIARESNRDEDTYAPEDLFDHLYKIDELREEHTQAEIAEKMGDEWSRSKVKQHSALLSNVVTGVLDKARDHQRGRVTEEVSPVTFDFTEYWFRTSGLYDLDSEWQEQFMDWFVNGQNCKAGKQKVTRKVEELVDIQHQLELLESTLNEGVDEDTGDELRKAVKRNEYTTESLRDAIDAANKDAKDQTYFGVNSVEKLQEFEDNEFACVVTDPPYGVDYESHRDNDRPSFGEDESDALDLMHDVFVELKRVCKANAHLYIFFPTKLFHEVKSLIGEFFEVDFVPLIWVKDNHAPTQDTKQGFKRMYAQQYEPVFFCKMENGDSRELNGSISRNVLEHDVPKGDARWHNSQKPISLLEELITNSTGKRETVLDPFAGSGSTLLAAKKTGRHYVGIEKDDEYESRFKRELREIEDGGDSDE